MSITKYYTKVKSVWDEIDNFNPLPICTCNGCSCGLTKKVLKLQQDQRLMSFLMKVDDQYSQVKTNVLMLPELPNVPTAYRMLYQEQKHKELARLHVSSLPSNSMAFTASKKYFLDNSHLTSRFSKHHTPDAGVFNKYKNGIGKVTRIISVITVKSGDILLRGVSKLMVIHLDLNIGALLAQFKTMNTNQILIILASLLRKLIVSWLS